MLRLLGGPGGARRMQSTVSVLRSAAELQAAVERPRAVVNLSAAWCGPCRAMTPVYKRLSEEHRDVSFYKVDIDELPEAAHQFGVTGVPTYVVLRDGREHTRVVGADPRALEQALKLDG
ncbi:AaceriAGL229Cp [[Ashbya] aceris (nom. inval.)]|nr:AaceriAGL229Cp [[Ashbya] aceris (nom. inval.)]